MTKVRRTRLAETSDLRPQTVVNQTPVVAIHLLCAQTYSTPENPVASDLGPSHPSKIEPLKEVFDAGQK